MDCPRCLMALAPTEYEDQQVHFCSTCWGYWLKQGQLDAITSGGEYSFSRAEVRAIEASMSQQGDAHRFTDESPAVNCPECNKRMQRRAYAEGSPVLIDECPAHGIWLDTGEIKDLQIFVEQHLQ